MREIGQGAYGFLQAQQVRVDPQDNVWVVDQMSTQVIKFDPNGRVQMILSRKPEAMRVPALPLTPAPDGRSGRADRSAGRRAAPAAGRRGGGGAAAARCRAPAPPARASTARPTSRGTRPATSTSPTATATRASRSTSRTASTSSRGAAAAPRRGQFNVVHGIAIDAQGNVYVADDGNRRIQVFDTEGTFKTQFRNVGTPTAICITPRRAASSSTSRTPAIPTAWRTRRSTRWISTASIVGKFGRAGKQLKEFGLVNSIDCRNENELLVGELSNWRVQKVTLGK